MAIYADLFFNNIRGFLEESFPVLHSLLPEDSWLNLVRDFFSRHSCRTPLFTRLAEEFVSYLQHQQDNNELDPPFLWELAHYEWVELALSISDAERTVPLVDPQGDLLQGHPVLSPLAWPLCYRYPVHKIDRNHQPGRPDDSVTCLLVYRSRNDEISFIEINPLIYWLLNLLQSDAYITGEDALEAAVEQLNPSDPEQVRSAGNQFLQELRQRDILIGTLPATQRIFS
jgi:hypothetical protein